MSEDLEPNPQPNEITPYQPRSQGDIIQSSSKDSDLDKISRYLAKKIEKSEDIDEISKVISVLSSVEDLKEKRIQQEVVKTQTQESRNEIKFRRRIEITEVVSKKVFGAASLGIGLSLLSSAPLFAPLLIIIGLSGFLDFNLKDVSDLLLSMNSNPSDRSEKENKN